MIHVDWKPDRATLRRFGLSLAVGGIVAGAVSAGWPGWLPAPLLLWSLATVAGVLALLIPAALRLLHNALWGVTFAVFWLLGAIVLALIYYGLLTPIGLALRLTGRDPIARRLEPDADSYWRPLKQPGLSDYFKQF